MAKKVRVYLRRTTPGDCRTFFEKTVQKNTEPGWPGDHYVDFELSQFFENIPVLKKGIREQIENDPTFVAASITTSIDMLKNSQSGTLKDVGITVDTSERPYLATIWSTTIAGAMEQMKYIAPASS